MRGLRRFGLVLVAASLVGAGESAVRAPAPAVAEEASLSERVMAFTTALRAAEKAEQGDRDARKALVEAMEGLEDRVEEIRTDYAAEWKTADGRHSAFAETWNEAVTLLRFHGDDDFDYILKFIRVQRNGLHVGVPAGGDWTHKYAGKSQHVVSLFQRSGPSGNPVCEVRVWRYRWDTVYSGVGGENYKKLADDDLEIDRSLVKKQGRKASRRVRSVRLNKEFSRAQYYFVEGHDVELEKRVRRRNYYLKDGTTSYCIEIIEFLDAETGDDRLKEWMRGEDCPERAALLASVTSETE